MWMPIWLHCGSVKICKHLPGRYSWYSSSNAHFVCISWAVAMGGVSACLYINWVPICYWWLMKCMSWFSFIWKELNFSHPVTFCNKKRKKVSGGDWEIHFKRIKHTPEFRTRQLVALFDSSHGFARTACWIALKSLGCICNFQQKLDRVM